MSDQFFPSGDIVVSDMVHGGRRFVFRHPVRLHWVDFGEDGLILSTGQGGAPLCANGADLTEAKLKFAEFLASTWDMVHTKPEDQLHPTILELKREMLKLVRQVETIPTSLNGTSELIQ